MSDTLYEYTFINVMARNSIYFEIKRSETNTELESISLLAIKLIQNNSEYKIRVAATSRSC